MEKVKLTTLFDQNKSKLSESLQGLTVPKDAEKIQQTISAFFTGLLSEDAEFRQNLTQSEDYILQAVLAVLNAHQARYSCLPTPEIQQSTTVEDSTAEPPQKKISNMPFNNAYPSIAAGFGALAGGAFLGTWGAVCGAIACTALTTYVVKNNLYEPQNAAPHEKTICSKAEFVEKPLDVPDIISVIYNLCASIDAIIVTFRAQINNVVQKYENQEKPSFEREHRTLLEDIQTLVGYARGHSEEEKFIKKILERIEDLAESLENYNLSLVDYKEENFGWFEAIPSSKATENRQVYPAIVKDGILVLKGKIFTPEK